MRDIRRDLELDVGGNSGSGVRLFCLGEEEEDKSSSSPSSSSLISSDLKVENLCREKRQCFILLTSECQRTKGAVK